MEIPSIQLQECNQHLRVHIYRIQELDRQQYGLFKLNLYIFEYIIAGKIQISNSTNMILDMQGGFKTEERGGVEVKVRIRLIFSTFLGKV